MALVFARKLAFSKGAISEKARVIALATFWSKKQYFGKESVFAEKQRLTFRPEAPFSKKGLLL